MAETHIVGVPASAIHSDEVVTGVARYTPDLNLPGMLVGKILYSPYPVARILRLNVNPARAVPGVRAVLTHEDIPGENSYLYAESDQQVLIEERINYQGDAIVAVAAETEDAAQAALDVVDVEFEQLEGIFDPLEAMKADAAPVLPGYENVIDHTVFDMGDLAAGFEMADVVIENTYSTPWIEHAYMETEGALAYLEPGGTVVVYASNQDPHRDRSQIARALGIPENHVRVITPYVGGAFGAKDEIHVQIHAALLALATKRPVQMIRTREESIRTHVKRHPVIIRHRLGARQDGKLTAVHVEAIGDTGPYVNAGKFIMAFGASMASGPYFVPNAKLEAYTVRTNNPISGAMRGFGTPQVCLAYEAQMDALAEALSMDPLEVRLCNAIESGQRTPAGGAIREAGGMKASLLEAARIAGWDARDRLKREPALNLRRGWGIGSTWFVIGMGRGKDNAGVVLQMAPDGSVVLRTAAVEMGQGVDTVLATIAAEALGLKLSAIEVVRPDTHSAPDAGPSVASRQTFVSGNAVLRAAAVIRKSLLEAGAEETGYPPDILSLHEGRLYAEGEVLSITVPELAMKASWMNMQLHATGFYAMEFPEEFRGKDNYFGVGPSSFGTQIAQVLVDIETGEVTIERLVAVHNVGKVISYHGAHGQLMGGAAMGIGYASMESLIVEDGSSINNSLESYLIPTALDVPEIETMLLEIPEPYGPLGAVGLGEPSLTPTAPAILNAVSDAIGMRLTQIPLTPERVLVALQSIGKDRI